MIEGGNEDLPWSDKVPGPEDEEIDAAIGFVHSLPAYHIGEGVYVNPGIFGPGRYTNAEGVPVDIDPAAIASDEERFAAGLRYVSGMRPLRIDPTEEGE
jgi:hypothetical protein